MDAGGLSREWMNLLIHAIFQGKETDLIIENEDRYVMRIDHVTPDAISNENVRYFRDTTVHSEDFKELFMFESGTLTISFTNHGYLPNPLYNYSHSLLSNQCVDYSLDEDTEPNCTSESINRNYHFVGRLIGRALFDGIPLGIPLNPLMYLFKGFLSRIKALLSSPLTENDIQLVNEGLLRGLHSLTQELQANPALESALDLHFSVDVQASVEGEGVVVEEVNLIHNGRNLRVVLTRAFSLGFLREHSGIQ